VPSAETTVVVYLAPSAAREMAVLAVAEVAALLTVNVEFLLFEEPKREPRSVTPESRHWSWLIVEVVVRKLVRVAGRVEGRENIELRTSWGEYDTCCGEYGTFPYWASKKDRVVAGDPGNSMLEGDAGSSTGKIVLAEPAELEELKVIAEDPFSFVVEFCGFFARQS